MIPKIIYNIWISDKPCPRHFQKNVESWIKFMPEYEIRYITTKTIPYDEKLNWLISQKLWVLANHYARYFILYHFGGIYMDLDVEVIKSFNDLLDKEIIIGREDNNWVNNAVIGCNKECPLMKECLEDMQKVNYRGQNLELETGPRLITKHKDLIPEILPPSYFYPYLYTEGFKLECIRPETHAIHHWEASWTKQPKHHD